MCCGGGAAVAATRLTCRNHGGASDGGHGTQQQHRSRINNWMEASASEPTVAAEEAASPSAAMSLLQAKKQLVPHAAKAWEFFRSIGSPKFHVAPMVDQVSNVSLLARSCMADPAGLRLAPGA